MPTMYSARNGLAIGVPVALPSCYPLIPSPPVATPPSPPPPPPTPEP